MAGWLPLVLAVSWCSVFTVVSIEIHIIDKLTEDGKLLSLPDCKKNIYKEIYIKKKK